MIMTDNNKDIKSLERRAEMNALQNKNSTGELLTLTQVCELSNLGATTVRRLAEESKSVRHIGRAYRINRKIFFQHIEKMYAE